LMKKSTLNERKSLYGIVRELSELEAKNNALVLEAKNSVTTKDKEIAEVRGNTTAELAKIDSDLQRALSSNALINPRGVIGEAYEYL
jgi:hypothetical protein